MKERMKSCFGFGSRENEILLRGKCICTFILNSSKVRSIYNGLFFFFRRAKLAKSKRAREREREKHENR